MTESSATARTIETSVHGRYLTIPPAHPGPAPLLVGFHGYAEDAETQLDRLRAIPGSSLWLCISIQALHRFYQRRTNQVVASWMTSQDRDHAIADNLRYVAACLETAAVEWPTLPIAVFAGFSQGVGMAFRAAVNSPFSARAVIAVGGDIPPEIGPENLRGISSVLLARGDADAWYKKDKLAEDEKRLLDCSVSIRTIEFDGGHVWPEAVTAAAESFLRRSHPDNI